MSRLYYLFLLIAIAACSNPSTTATVAEKETPQVTYPAITATHPVLQSLFQACDQLDYVYLDHPVSTSASSLQQARSFLSHISGTPAIVKEDCKPIAKIYYQIKGDIVMEADFYFELEREDCRYFVFYEGGKPAYANNITTEAVGQYAGLIQQMTTDPMNLAK